MMGFFMSKQTVRIMRSVLWGKDGQRGFLSQKVSFRDRIVVGWADFTSLASDSCTAVRAARCKQLSVPPVSAYQQYCKQLSVPPVSAYQQYCKQLSVPPVSTYQQYCKQLSVPPVSAYQQYCKQLSVPPVSAYQQYCKRQWKLQRQAATTHARGCSMIVTAHFMLCGGMGWARGTGDG
jgi:hypothetical protein